MGISDFKKSEKKIYRGVVIDEFKTMPTRYTKYYHTYQEAHEAAERLCKRTMGQRGKIDVDYGPAPKDN